MGIMYSSEAVMIDVCSSATTGEEGCCVWGTSADDILPASCTFVNIGSKVLLDEGRISSDSSARTVSSDIDEGVQVSYSVDIEGSGQTGNDTAVGKATVYVDAYILEGSGDETNQSAAIVVDESVTVDGLITLALSTGYSSP